MSNSNVDEARVTPDAKAPTPREIVEDIAAENGVFPVEFKLQAMQGDDDKRKLMKSNERLKAKLTNAVKSLSDNLYNSQSRFFLECIQNADDNKYDHGQSPFLRFIIDSDYIQIESNEDGFEESDIRAISSIGESTKTGEAAAASKKDPAKCIGEKRIGFKSVFKIATQVHIRSSPYTFMFDKESELGMITPQWDESFFRTREASPDVQTEIILMAPPRKGPVQNYAEDLREDFMSRRLTFLMFLRRLEHLQITIHATSNQGAINRSVSCVHFGNNRIQIREVEKSIKSRESISNYYRFRYRFGGLPTEAKRPNVKKTSCSIVLPIKLVEKDWEPLEARQSVFAYLPIADFGFKFIIQADFLTTSNREGIEESGLWNENIRGGIALVFADTIEALLHQELGNDAAICYTWMRYLSRNSERKSGFWAILDKNILRTLKARKIILSRTGSLLQPGTSIFMEWAHDRDMIPLFGSESDYVSQRYQVIDKAYLLMLGVRTPSAQWLVDELSKLDRKEGFKSKSTTWHEDTAKVINEILRDSHSYDLWRLPLIPLEDGSWVKSPVLDEDVFFPESIGTNIPIDVNFRLVEKRASQNAERRKLFARLGVKVCNMQDVVDQIAAKHSKAMQGEPLIGTPAILVSHAMYLYHASKHGIKPKLPKNEQFIYLIDDAGVAMRGRSLYLNRSKVPDELYSDSARSQSCHFLHPLYLESLQPEEHPSFVSWLEKVACLATVLRLQLQSDRELHPDFRFFMDNRPDDVLSTLKANWSQYKQQLSPSICTAIKNHRVLCLAGAAESRLALSETFVPEEKIVQRSRELSEGDCHFLQLPCGRPADWSFLKTFHVGFEEDVKFFIWILFQDVFRMHCSIGRAKNLFKLIQEKCKDANISEIRSRFDYNLILIKSNGEDDDLDAWCSPIQAVWSAPQGIAGAKVSLRPIYGQEFEYFFCTMLGIQNASVQEVVLDLKESRQTGFSDVKGATQVYEYLQALCVNHASNVQFCQKYFSDFALILVSGDNGTFSWKKPSDCVWSNEAFRKTTLKLKSKAALSADYNKNLVYFFTNVLEIRDAGLEEFIADLQLLRTNESTDEATVQILYKLIQSSASDDENLVRTSFNNFDSILIYASDQKIAQWYPLSKCVWSAPKYLKGKIMLSNYYPHLQDLFCQTLSVTNATPGMLINELLEVTRSERSANATKHSKALILGLAAYTKSGIATDRADLTLLQTQKCWPCCEGESTSFQALSKAYANDRQNFWNIFSAHIYMLDFSFEQIQTLNVLLKQLEFGNYLSEHVHMETHLSHTGDIDEESTGNLRARADALYKCACELSNEKATQDRTALKSLLNGISVYQSSAITTIYTLNDLKESRDNGGLHIELNDALKLYVSTDPKKRKYALHTLLPNEMITTVLKIPQQQSYQVISSVLQLDLGMLDWVLVEQGIISGQAAEVSTESSTDLAIFSPPLITKSQFNSVIVGRDKNGNIRDPQQQNFEDRDITGTGNSSDQSRASSPRSLPTTPETQTASTSSTPSKRLRDRENLSSNAEASSSKYLGDIEHLTPQAPSSSQDLNHLTRSPRQLPDCSQIPFLTGDNIKKWTENFKERAGSIQDTRFQVESATKSGLLSPRTLSSSIDQGCFDMSSLSYSLQEKIDEREISANQDKKTHSGRSFFSSPRSDAQRARKFGLGFLGELFTVTKLKEAYKLPEFTAEDNWRSSLREYAGFDETKDDISDIIYKDIEGTFTRCLLQQYRESKTQPPKWLQTYANPGPGPEYFLEVKTTTDSLETPFFMSNAQFNNAKKRTFKENVPMEEVYVIVRVYDFPISEDCDAKGAKICMYLDPYALYQEGTLRFEAKEYAIFPGK